MLDVVLKVFLMYIFKGSRLMEFCVEATKILVINCGVTSLPDFLFLIFFRGKVSRTLKGSSDKDVLRFECLEKT